MSLAYRPNPGPAGTAFERIEPGACSWSVLDVPGTPVEPGVVYFDLAREGGPYIPDPARMSKWLRDPRHYWVFYVDDVTNLSLSHGSYGGNFHVPTLDEEKPPAAPRATRARERLRCRGGPGLAFVRGERKGPNLFGMTLGYAAAPTAAGPIGKGLEPGSCAWADRAGAEREPGRIEFTTARNAQREQEQSGGPVDSSATAAERWPDVRTIPAYMTDPAHYWTFTVRLANPDSALRHNAWNPSVPEDDTPVATTPGTPAAPSGDDPYTSGSPRESSTGVSLPGGSTTGDRYTPGSPSRTTDQVGIFDIRNVQVTSGLEGVAIRFEAAPNLSPTVTVHTAAPTGGTGSLRFEGQPVRLVVQGTGNGGTHWRYSAASTTPLARGTRYWFIADAPEGPQSRANQTTGEFRTLAQHVKIGISHITVVSDGDPDSPGDMWFTVRSCPKNLIDGDLAGSSSSRVQWSEGRYRLSHELASAGTSAPDRFRVFIVGIDDDEHLLSSYGSSHPFWVHFHCSEYNAGTLEPKATSKAEWNAAVLDLDLRQYTGTQASQTFIKRSQPLRDGSKVAFEVHGYVEVTRE